MTIFSNGKKQKLHEVIFEADTPLGKAFDVFLIWTILASVVVVMLESVADIDLKYGRFFNVLEWIFTIFFTLEYFARIYSLRKPIHYITSFYGIIDLCSFLPTYLSLLLVGTQALMV